jgi:hypothetical protein
VKVVNVIAELVLTALLAGQAAAASVGESEPNGRGKPTPIPAPLAAFLTAFPDGDVLVTGTLEAGDVDFFSLQLTVGQLLMVGAFDEHGGELSDARLGLFYEAPSANDPDVAPDAGNENDDGGPGFLPRLAVSIPQSGTWKIGLSGYRDLRFEGDHLEARSSPIPYRLVVAVTTAAQAPGETESANDTSAGADLLPAGGAVLRASLDRGDVDWSAIDLAAGEGVTFSLFDLQSDPLPFASADGERNDTRLALFDPNGVAVADGANDDGGPGFLSNLAFTVPAGEGGRYRLAVSGYRDFGFTGSHLTGPLDYALVVATTASSVVERCDVNGDAFVDQTDVNAIFLARGQSANGPSDPRDANGDGSVTILDSRACVLQCNSPNCAPRPSSSCGLLGIEVLAALGPWAFLRERRRGARGRRC